MTLHHRHCENEDRRQTQIEEAKVVAKKQVVQNISENLSLEARRIAIVRKRRLKKEEKAARANGTHDVWMTSQIQQEQKRTALMQLPIKLRNEALVQEIKEARDVHIALVAALSTILKARKLAIEEMVIKSNLQIAQNRLADAKAAVYSIGQIEFRLSAEQTSRLRHNKHKIFLNIKAEYLNAHIELKGQWGRSKTLYIVAHSKLAANKVLTAVQQATTKSSVPHATKPGEFTATITVASAKAQNVFQRKKFRHVCASDHQQKYYRHLKVKFPHVHINVIGHYGKPKVIKVTAKKQEDANAVIEEIRHDLHPILPTNAAPPATGKTFCRTASSSSLLLCVSDLPRAPVHCRELGTTNCPEDATCDKQGRWWKKVPGSSEPVEIRQDRKDPRKRWYTFRAVVKFYQKQRKMSYRSVLHMWQTWAPKTLTKKQKVFAAKRVKAVSLEKEKQRITGKKECMKFTLVDGVYKLVKIGTSLCEQPTKLAFQEGPDHCQWRARAGGITKTIIYKSIDPRAMLKGPNGKLVYPSEFYEARRHTIVNMSGA